MENKTPKDNSVSGNETAVPSNVNGPLFSRTRYCFRARELWGRGRRGADNVLFPDSLISYSVSSIFQCCLQRAETVS